MAQFLFPHFPRHLEAAFQVQYNRDAAKINRVALLLGIVLFLSFYIWDRTVDLDDSPAILALRLIVFIVLLSTLLLPKILFVRHQQEIMTSCMLFAAAAHIIILSIMKDGWKIGIPGII